MNLDHILAILREQKCRITNPRKLILETLVKHQSILLSAEDILTEVAKTDSSINLTTVYRNLELLESLDLLYTMSLDQKTQSYKLVCMDHHHHHITCTECGHMTPIDFCPVTDHLKNLSREVGYALTDHTLELFGVCDECSNE